MAQGVEPLASSPTEFTAQINTEMAYWARMFKLIKIKPE
jgi:tripartite-type tricarboxylate transporter receptor subunit TctC